MTFTSLSDSLAWFKPSAARVGGGLALAVLPGCDDAEVFTARRRN